MGLIELKAGPTVPSEAISLGLSLEARGLILKVDGDRLRVSGANGAKPDLSSEDAEQIRKWKFHLMALCTYEAPKPEWI